MNNCVPFYDLFISVMPPLSKANNFQKLPFRRTRLMLTLKLRGRLKVLSCRSKSVIIKKTIGDSVNNTNGVCERT